MKKVVDHKTRKRQKNRFEKAYIHLMNAKQIGLWVVVSLSHKFIDVLMKKIV